MNEATLKGKVIVFTGGGSAGHVVPNIPIINRVIELGAKVVYMGSYKGPEREIIKKQYNDMRFYAVVTDKFRRYFSLKTLFLPFKLTIGIIQAFFYLIKIKPALVFSKGGFVSLPVVIAAYLKRIPVVGHESDISIGLANKLALPFIKVLCTAAPLEWIHESSRDKKMVSTGIPLRESIISPENVSLNFPIDENAKVLLVFGGSLGANAINDVIWQTLDKLKEYTVVHITGAGKMNNAIQADNYYQVEFVYDEMGALLRRADIIVCRAGMTTLLELIALKKSAILVPLSKAASRGDQLDNAGVMQGLKLFQVIYEHEFSPQKLMDSIKTFEQAKDSYLQRIKDIQIDVTPDSIIQQILKVAI